jgi:YVTN family beta-propeller protein
MKFSPSTVVLFSALFLAPFINAQDAGTLLVLSKQDHTLAMVDPATLQVIAKAPVGEDPHEVITSTDGSTAYVSNYGFGAYHSLAVINLRTHQAEASVDLGPLRGPHGLTFVGGRTWFTAEGAKVIGRYDPETRKVDWVLGTGQDRTHMINVSPDQQTIVTTNVNSGTVSIIEQADVPTPGPPPGAGGPQRPRRDWHQTVIPVGHGSEGFDITPDRKEIWVANAQDGTISVIDFAGKKVVDTLAANVRSANRLKFTLDGKYALVSLLSGPDLVVIDVHTRKGYKRIPIGHGAAGIEMEPGGGRAFVACTPDNHVAVIDLKTFQVTGHIQAGGQPDGMAWAVR